MTVDWSADEFQMVLDSTAWWVRSSIGRIGGVAIVMTHGDLQGVTVNG